MNLWNNWRNKKICSLLKRRFIYQLLDFRRKTMNHQVQQDWNNFDSFRDETGPFARSADLSCLAVHWCISILYAFERACTR